MNSSDFAVRLGSHEAVTTLKGQPARLPVPSGSGNPLAQSGCSFPFPIPMLLRDLVRALPSATVEGALDREIAGLTYDSRRVTPGMLFVAIPGQHTDGHEFIDAAVERGAAAILCERRRSVPARVTQISVPDVREALACAARALYVDPSAQLQVLGVTGINGN